MFFLGWWTVLREQSKNSYKCKLTILWVEKTQENEEYIKENLQAFMGKQQILEKTKKFDEILSF